MKKSHMGVSKSESGNEEVSRHITNSRQLAKMMRPQNMRVGLVAYILLAVHTKIHPQVILLSGFMIILSYGAATIYNDLNEINIDTANHRDLPLVTNKLSKQIARNYLLGVCLLLVMMQPSLPQPGSIIYLVTFLTLSWAYSAPAISIAKRGLWATFLLSLCYYVLPLLLVELQSRGTCLPRIVYPAGILLTMAGLLFKDFKDEVGDRLFGKLTPLIIYGKKRVIVMSVVLFVMGALVFMQAAIDVSVAISLVIAAASLYGLIGHPSRRDFVPEIYKASIAAAVVLVCFRN